MKFFDIIFLGIYTILNKSYNLHSVSKNGFGPKEHSFYISLAIHTMNIDSLCSYLTITYLHRDFGIYMSLLILVVVIIIGYLIYYKGKRAEIIINKHYANGVTVLYVFISLLYIVVSAYLMHIVGNHNREVLTGESVDINKTHLVGVYYATPSINTFDTLTLNNKGEYAHVIYRKKDSSLVLRNTGKWDVEIDRIILNNFLLNKDEKYNEGENNFGNLPTYSFPYKNPLGTAMIPFGERTNDYYYTKNK